MLKKQRTRLFLFEIDNPLSKINDKKTKQHPPPKKSQNKTKQNKQTNKTNKNK